MSKLRILIVEDSPLVRDVLRAALSSEDSFDVIGSAEDGKEGVEKALALKPDFITMDINMPVMNGFEFLEEYKDLPETVQQKAKVIMLSSSINPRDVEKAKGFSQVMDYMNKPLSQASLKDLMQELEKAGE